MKVYECQVCLARFKERKWVCPNCGHPDIKEVKDGDDKVLQKL